MPLKSTLCGCIAVLGVLAFAGAATAQTREITMGLASTSFATAAPRVAKEMGLFQKHGIDPKFVVMDNANAATTALISKSVDAALSGPGEVVVAQARGQKIVVLANAYASMSGTLVLAKSVADKLGLGANAPVGARLKALDGLLIGSTSATGVYTVAIKGAAQAAGANVRFTYMAQPAMSAALESGSIQGYIAGAPFWAAPVVRGLGVQWISGPKGELPSDHVPANSSNLQMMRAYAEANPGVVKSLTNAMSDFARDVTQRPAEVKAAVSQAVSNSGRPHVGPPVCNGVPGVARQAGLRGRHGP